MFNFLAISEEKIFDHINLQTVHGELPSTYTYTVISGLLDDADNSKRQNFELVVANQQILGNLSAIIACIKELKRFYKLICSNWATMIGMAGHFSPCFASTWHCRSCEEDKEM